MNNKNKILVGCLALLLVLSVGYAIFSDTITINGTATAKGDFDITATCAAGIPSEYGTAESLGLPAEGGYENDSCTVTDDTIAMKVDFLYPTAKRYFTIKMTNSGSMDATLSLNDIKKDGEFCSADNKEGTNQTCTDYTSFGTYSGGVFAMFNNVLAPVAFEDENGELTIFDGSSSDFIDTTNSIVTLKPNQSALWIVTSEFHEDYGTITGTSEFFISYDLTLDYLWNQKASS